MELIFIDEESTFYCTTKLGKNLMWKIWRDGSCIYRQSGYVDGKLKDPVLKKCKGKNIGRSNETTPEGQAKAEMESMINKQIDKGYIDTLNYADNSIPSKIQKTETFSLYPMLAHPYTEKNSRKIKYPCIVDAKLDGIRCLAHMDEGSSLPTMYSRMSKEFSFLDSIRRQTKRLMNIYNKMYGDQCLFIDGELYSHSLTFSEIQSITRRAKTASPKEHLLEYHIFDVVSSDGELVCKERRIRLKKVYEEANKNNTLVYIKLVPYKVCKKEQDIHTLHNYFVKGGYEGIVIRNFNGLYLQKYRSFDLQKLKYFDDSECTIVGFKEGQGTEEGCVVWECKWKYVSGDITRPAKVVKFECRPRGSFDDRHRLLENADKYIGRKDYTFRYQGVSKDGVPRFPVGIGFRGKT